MPLAVTQISNLYSLDISGKKHYVEDELMLSDTKVLFCDVFYAGANVPYINLNLYNHTGDNLSLSKSIKMFPFKDFDGGRAFGVGTEKLWAPSIGTDVEEETITEATELEGTLIYDITVPGDVNEKVGPVRVNGDYSYYDYSPAPVAVNILYRPQTCDQWCSANGDVEIYALLEMLPGDEITVEEQ